jgi:hypothetical protein
MFGGDTDECLWRVGLVLDDEDDIGSMAPMGLTILGPDGKAWWMSGSWLYDPEIWQKALAHLYIEGVADLVDPDELAHHVGLITEQRNNAIVALPDAARRGELRWVPKEDAVTAIWPPNRRVGALFSTAVVREDEREVLKGGVVKLHGPRHVMGDEGVTLCGIPSDEVVLWRTTFAPWLPGAYAVCEVELERLGDDVDQNPAEP